MNFRSGGWLTAVITVGIFGYISYRMAKSGNTQAALIMGGIAAAIVISVGTYFTLRMLKGSLTASTSPWSASANGAVAPAVQVPATPPIGTNSTATNSMSWSTKLCTRAFAKAWTSS